MGGLEAMMSTPAGKAYVNSVGVMVLVFMGRRVSHPRVAVRGRRSGYRLRSRVSMCDVAASGYIFGRVDDITA